MTEPMSERLRERINRLSAVPHGAAERSGAAA
jgi:hypothetical protein